MKKVVTLILILSFSALFSQSITGIVVDKNDEPLAGATVYFDGSSFGTSTNFDGEFKITLPSEISATLVVSFVGFDKVYLNKLNFDKPYKIILKESTEDLREIVLMDNKFSRKQMMALFKNQFLGTTRAGNQCKIENEDEIYFSYDNDRFVLTAYADKPLIIDNPYLGYKVYFDLTTFDAKFNQFSIERNDVYSSIYVGTSRFEEIDNSNRKLKNREKVFNGSFLELFRNMANKEWSKNKFTLFKGSFQTIPEEHLYIKDTLGLKQIFIKKQERGLHAKDFVAEFSLLYNRREQSKIIFHTDNFVIDKYGLFSNYDKIYFSGDLSEKKVGDLLPSNYGIE
ncbi:carboxypeptidase-like regulatory domain-containing protein [Flavobacterium gelidilacus]|uniref:carboxypeptidase-like regulatory domain-containing protein n=1 Tax=Flavobacterium gelidilacus TaxID=206041 RepID=UPI00040A3742|nr:carboxypeptidase-like regulatory domain-containing protein [Flavobacterium gelidilacus]